MLLKGAFSTYKYVLFHRDYWPLLSIHVGSGPSQEYYVEMTLPFGHRLVPKIFTTFSDALVWIVHEVGAGFLFKYVDDFASAQPAGSDLCHRDLYAVQAACDLTGFESQEEKREGPSTCLAVVGVEVDTIAWEMHIGKDKQPTKCEHMSTGCIQFKFGTDPSSSC